MNIEEFINFIEDESIKVPNNPITIKQIPIVKIKCKLFGEVTQKENCVACTHYNGCNFKVN